MSIIICPECGGYSGEAVLSGRGGNGSVFCGFECEACGHCWDVSF